MRLHRWARAPRASRVERGGFSRPRSQLSSLSHCLSQSLQGHTQHISYTHLTRHTLPGPGKPRLSASVSPQFPPPPRTVRCDAHTRSSLYSLTLSELLKDSKNTRGDPRGRATERVRRRHPTPTTGATRVGLGAHTGHRSWGAGRGPADAWPGVWRVACRSRAERGVHSARAEVRRVRARHSWPSRKPPLYKF